MPNDAPDWTSAVTGVQSVIGTLSAPANGSGNATYDVPAGTQAIGYLVRTDAGADTPAFVIVQGQTTFNDYFTAAPSSNIGGVQWAPFDTKDAQVKATLNASIPSPAKIDVLASPMALAVNAVQRFGDTWAVELATGTGFFLATTQQTNGKWTLGVDLTSAPPAPWQRMAEDGHDVVANVQPGAASRTIPAPGVGVSIILNRATFTIDNRTGAAQVQGIRVWDGASGSTLIWFSALQAAAGGVDRGGLESGSFVKGSPNTAMTLDFSGGAANLNESISCGWYLTS